jgi:hypothetical protein
MRKLLTIMLAVAMVCALTITANADTLGTENTAGSKDVNGTYVAGQKAGTVYSVNVEWGSLEFTFTDASEGTWDPATKTYVNQTEAFWAPNSETADKVTVTNNSNAEVTVSFAFTAAEGCNVTAAFDKATATLPSAADPEAETSVVAKLSITGGTITESGKLGEVTVTLNTPAPTPTSDTDTHITVTFTDNAEKSLANSDGDIYLYAWNGADLSINNTWPGVKMTKGEGNAYTFDLDLSTYDHIILGNGLNNTDAGWAQTVDIDLTTLGGNYNIHVTDKNVDTNKYEVSNG